MSGLGDVNGDGTPEIVVHFPRSRLVWVLSGRKLELVHEIELDALLYGKPVSRQPR